MEIIKLKIRYFSKTKHGLRFCCLYSILAGTSIIRTYRIIMYHNNIFTAIVFFFFQYFIQVPTFFSDSECSYYSCFSRMSLYRLVITNNAAFLSGDISILCFLISGSPWLYNRLKKKNKPNIYNITRLPSFTQNRFLIEMIDK